MTANGQRNLWQDVVGAARGTSGVAASAAISAYAVVFQMLQLGGITNSCNYVAGRDSAVSRLLTSLASANFPDKSHFPKHPDSKSQS